MSLACPLVEEPSAFIPCLKPYGPRPLPPEHFFMMQQSVNLIFQFIDAVQILISSSYCFALKQIHVLPKVCRLHVTKADLHCFIFSNSLFMGLPETIEWVQGPRIICSHSRCDTHFSSNRWSLCRRPGAGAVTGVVSSNIVS